MVTGFRWITLLYWMLSAFGLLALHLLMLGIPGAIAYESWQVVLNTLLQREVIADTSGLGSATWVLVLYLGVFLPWGLPLGYVMTTWLPRARMQRLPSLVRARITWILLIELLWTLAVVLFFSASVHDMT
ncbi:MAG: hypothetical protein AAF773_06390 [Cyanobacteria bacterium P01_D01_bin.115]